MTTKIEQLEADPNVTIIARGHNGSVICARKPDIEDHVSPVFEEIVKSAMKKRNNMDKVIYDMYKPDPIRPVIWANPSSRIDKIAYVTALTIIDENKLLALTDEMLDKTVEKVRALQVAHEEKSDVNL